MNFWQKLPKPFSMLSPMEDITDTVFRQMLCKHARPDVFFTEFVNVDGMFSEGRDKVRQRLKFNKIEKPIVAQIWGNNPEKFYQAAKKISNMGFDGIDINFGCSQSDVLKHNCGAALIGQEKLVEEIIAAVKKGANGLPVSVKTRLGIKTIVTDSWIKFLLNQNLQAIILHGRLACDNYSVPADWEEIGQAVRLRNDLKKDTLIIGNGDVKDIPEIQEKYHEYQVDGVAIARAVLGNPWCFKKTSEITVLDRLKLLNQHIRLFNKTWKNQKPYVVIKKYIKMYIQGFPQAQSMRAKLMQANSYPEIEQLIKKLS